MKPPGYSGKRGRPRPHQTWVSHPRISRQLIRHDCSVIGLLADMAKDEGTAPELRFRVLEKLATLLYLPSEPAAPRPPTAEEQADAEPGVAEIIAAAWSGASKP